jgi:transcriptional regulator with XRE-family HTH domain
VTIRECINSLPNTFVYAYIFAMNNMARIRREVFCETQAAYAAIAGISQGTVSRWEAGELDPTRPQLARIRREARRRKLRWRDSWFFEFSTGTSRAGW